jgi:nitrile hydratase
MNERDHGHHPAPLAPIEARVAAIESVLVEQGLLDEALLDRIIEDFEHNLGPMNGAKVVARAWTDPDYRQRLLTDATAAISELGFGGAEGDTVLLLPMAHARPAAQVVQGACLPVPGRSRAPGLTRRVRHGSARRR